jgi:hypothetical protein
MRSTTRRCGESLSATALEDVFALLVGLADATEQEDCL